MILILGDFLKMCLEKYFKSKHHHWEVLILLQMLIDDNDDDDVNDNEGFHLFWKFPMFLRR